VLRWCATLIARPDIRMGYALLLISETQGVGKGTLGEKILAPLVGMDNVSFPSEQELVDSAFNYWAAHKRLAVVHEIYAGENHKANDKLKSFISDGHFEVNRKYQSLYQVENWVHIFACSNSFSAIKLETNEERRWFIPRVTEKQRSKEYWEKINEWLTREGGLGKIAFWASQYVENQENVVAPAERPPETETKKKVVREAYSTGMERIASLLEQIIEDAGDGPVVVLDTELVRAIKEVINEGRTTGFLEKPRTVRKVAHNLKLKIGDDRLKIRNWAGMNAFDSRLITNKPELLQMDKMELVRTLKPVNVVELLRKTVTM
jgi:hypothetical protein